MDPLLTKIFINKIRFTIDFIVKNIYQQIYCVIKYINNKVSNKTITNQKY